MYYSVIYQKGHAATYSNRATGTIGSSTSLIECPYYQVISVLELLPGILSSGMILITSILLVVVHTRCKNTKVSKKLHKIAGSTIEKVYKKLIVKHGSKTREGERVYIVSNYRAPNIYIDQLFITLMQLIGVAAFQFLDEFLLERDPQFCTRCCYDLNSSTNAGQPLDCLNKSYIRDIDICYRFPFKVGTAITSALGVLMITGLLIFGITLFLLKISKGTSRTVCRLWVTVVVQITAVLLVLGVSAVLCVLKLSSYSIKSFKKTFDNILFEVAPVTLIIIFYITLFPWYKFEKITKHEHNAQRYELLTTQL